MEGVLDHPHLLSEVSELNLTQSLGEDICHLFSCRSVPQLHNSSLDIVSDEMATNVNVLRPVMKHKILGELDATLIITHNPSQFYPLLE